MPPALYVLATVWLWSLIPLAVKVAYQSFDFGCIGFARLSVGTLFFAIWELSSGRHLRLPKDASAPPPPRASFLVWTIIAGLGIGGDLLLYALGLRYTTASAATLIVSTDGIILALLGVMVLRERMSWMKAVAGLCALGGLFLVNWSGQTWQALLGSEHFLGNVIVFIAGCCWAMYGLGQRVLARIPGGNLFWIFAVGTLLASGVAFTRPLTHAPVTWQAVAAIAYLGLGGTGLAYVLLAKGMAKLEAATVGILNSTLPLFTMVQAHYWLGEEITVYLVGGACLVIAGVMLIMSHQRRYGV